MKTGIEELRELVKAFDRCSEDFLSRFTVAELLKLRAAWKLAEWDYYPDQWTEHQVKEALRGRVPQWDENGRPFERPRARRKLAGVVMVGALLGCGDADSTPPHSPDYAGAIVCNDAGAPVGCVPDRGSK